MGNLYRWLVYLDKKKFRFEHYERVWELFEPKPKYNLVDMIELALMSFLLGIGWLLKNCVLKPLKWVNEHCTVGGN